MTDIEKIQNFIEWFSPTQEIKEDLLKTLDSIKAKIRDSNKWETYFDNLSMRTRNCLKNANIKSFDVLIEKYKNDSLIKSRTFGKKSLEEIEQTLKQLGKL